MKEMPSMPAEEQAPVTKRFGIEAGPIRDELTKILDMVDKAKEQGVSGEGDRAMAYADGYMRALVQTGNASAQDLKAFLNQRRKHASS